MDNKLEIKISDTAYNKLKTLLSSHSDEYSCIKLSYNRTCCKTPGIEIFLDDFENKKGYTTQNFKDITFIYNNKVIENIKKVELIYKNSNFMIKTIPLNPPSNNCSSCHGGCNGCKH
ncbi:hypothetical protein [Clostridium ganghwense]|uniref:Fe-S cluster assembly protein HesB n=1 Tax=Clostridium ganghwense TaxID=312089 RepID=A0ABT4CRF5_9CLOT|nr:hypothetical protein [Clostridium ganghwense]MCY6371619.1 hypothetical protein [Clostridium ganghwense]